MKSSSADPLWTSATTCSARLNGLNDLYSRFRGANYYGFPGKDRVLLFLEFLRLLDDLFLLLLLFLDLLGFLGLFWLFCLFAFVWHYQDEPFDIATTNGAFLSTLTQVGAALLA
jgi:hypothetical protein